MSRREPRTGLERPGAMPDLPIRLPFGRRAVARAVLALALPIARRRMQRRDAAAPDRLARRPPRHPSAPPIVARPDRRRDRPQDGRDRRRPAARGRRRLRPDRLPREPGADLHALWQRRDRVPAEGRERSRSRTRPASSTGSRGGPRSSTRARSRSSSSSPSARAALGSRPRVVRRQRDRGRPEHDLHDRCGRRRQDRRHQRARGRRRPRAPTRPPGPQFFKLAERLRDFDHGGTISTDLFAVGPLSRRPDRARAAGRSDGHAVAVAVDPARPSSRKSSCPTAARASRGGRSRRPRSTRSGSRMPSVASRGSSSPAPTARRTR